MGRYHTTCQKRAVSRWAMARMQAQLGARSPPWRQPAPSPHPEPPPPRDEIGSRRSRPDLQLHTPPGEGTLEGSWRAGARCEPFFLLI
ncbi:hypothetical protein NDU88_003997 [Pleurodeles waltl]|uniref:Uncharacterized protein n=1 Tax=Pleurodeles waltl TaxID=8319 RepID=A0AAV7W931_PLEWA|nr:hypothetical protein NDU88_003997 [Pleurodeles waltl]